MKTFLKIWIAVFAFAAVAIQFTGVATTAFSPMKYGNDSFAFGFPSPVYYARFVHADNPDDWLLPVPLSLRIFCFHPAKDYRTLSHGIFLWEQPGREDVDYQIYIPGLFFATQLFDLRYSPEFSSPLPGVIANGVFVFLVFLSMFHLYRSITLKKHYNYWMIVFISLNLLLLLYLILVGGPAITHRIKYGYTHGEWFFYSLATLNFFVDFLIFFCYLDWIFIGVRRVFRRR